MISNKKSSDVKDSKKGNEDNNLSVHIEEIIRQIDTRNDALKKIYEFFKKDEPKKTDQKKDD